MSATTADGVVTDVPPTEETKRGLRRLLKRARQRCAKGARRTWSGAKSAARWAGRTITRGIGIIGATTIWIIKSALFVVTSAVAIVAFAAIALLIGIASIVVYALAQVYDLIHKYLYLPLMWLARGRPVSWKMFRTQDDLERTESHTKVRVSIKDRIKNLGLDEVLEDAEAAMGDDDEIVVTPKIKRAPLTDPLSIDDEELRKNLAGFARVAAEFVAQAQESPTLHIPGVTASIPVEVEFDPESKLENPDDIFSNEGAVFEPHLPAIQAYFASGDLAVDFDFTPFLNDVENLLMSYEFLRETSGNLIEERSYWHGRFEMLRRWHNMPSKAKKNDLLDEHGRVWALIHSELLHRQDVYSLKHVGAGFKAQAEELNNARKATANR